MNKRLVINVAVADWPSPTAFLKAFGYAQNPQFTGDTAAWSQASELVTPFKSPRKE